MVFKKKDIKLNLTNGANNNKASAGSGAVFFSKYPPNYEVKVMLNIKLLVSP